MEKNPWKTLAKKEMYDNPWIRIEEHKVINPSGNEGIYGVVHMKIRAIGVVPYEDGYIWLVGQYRYVLDQYSWEIPEGGCPEGETTLQTAKRELKEETGFLAKEYSPILQMHISNSITDEWGIVYLAKGLTPGEAEPEETEELRTKRMKLEEVYDKIESGEITDSLTVAAVYKLMLMKCRGELVD